MKQDWFENWFDSPYYHILYQHRNEQEAKRFITNLVGYLHPKPEANFLDLACGKGRHSNFINQLGYPVDGLDLSEKSIEHAASAETENLKFLVADMRKPFGIRKYDYILNLFTSFGYFKDNRDNEKVLKNAQKALKPNGKLVIDYLNAKKTVAELVSTEKQSFSGIDFHITRKHEGGKIIKSINFKDGEASYSFQETVQAFTLRDFEILFASADLQLTDYYGNYNLESFDESFSDRLILIAEST